MRCGPCFRSRPPTRRLARAVRLPLLHRSRLQAACSALIGHSLSTGLAHSLTEPEVQAVFANAALLTTLATVLKKGKKNIDEGKTGDAKDAEGGGEDVRYVVYDGKCEDEVRAFC